MCELCKQIVIGVHRLNAYRWPCTVCFSLSIPEKVSQKLLIYQAHGVLFVYKKYKPEYTPNRSTLKNHDPWNSQCQSS